MATVMLKTLDRDRAPTPITMTNLSCYLLDQRPRFRALVSITPTCNPNIFSGRLYAHRL